MGLAYWKHTHEYEPIERIIGHAPSGEPVTMTTFKLKGSKLNDEVMTGLNPQADDRLAADLGVKLVKGDSIEKIVSDTKAFYYSLGFSAGIRRAIELSLVSANTTMTREEREESKAHLDMCDQLQKEHDLNTAKLLTLVDQAKEAGLVS